MTNVTTSIRGPEQLVEFLNGELGFYRSLCALMQKQRDRLVRGEERELPADLEEIGFLQKQIESGEALLRRARDEGGDQFNEWLAQPDVSALLNGRHTGFSLTRLMTLLNRLDRDVEIVVRRRPRSRARSRLIVHAE